MIKTCLDYHQETSYDRHRMGGHFLDWADQPALFKTYEGIERVSLPREVELPKRRFSSLVLDRMAGRPATTIDLDTLSRLLLLANTLTAKARTQGGDFYFRSAASAGALYPTEIYAATRGVTGLDDGLYHYGLRDHSLTPLRSGNFGASIMESGKIAEEEVPVVTFFLTAIFYRSAWKYRARAYRYHLLDTGHVEENLALGMKALGFSYDASYHFDDDRVNHLLGLDGKREAALALISLKGQDVLSMQGKREADQLPASIFQASRVSAKEVEYPAIREMHEAGRDKRPEMGQDAGMLYALGPASREWREIESSSRNEIADYPDCVFMRRSKRNFVRSPLRKNHAAGLLQALCASDQEEYKEALCPGVLIGMVEGMEQGFYLLDRNRKASGMVRQGSYLDTMAHICLDQAWLANAGVHFLFLANLDLVDRSWGPRGYRYAMMVAGRAGQRLYVASTAMGLGCCGIGAFYDGEARELLGLNENSRLLYLVAVGVVKR
ncbi:MAG: SagB/ThcOx family dehydrogenase [Deltaproteobacteria bacterium]|nr:SagB/ThcOx family dehydrogenase [Deltaproteobacteria bacterium]